MSSRAGFGIYVHWPFCVAKCPYCDFNSHVRARVDQGRWRHALLAELEHAAQEAPDRSVTSVFFGGGTPSLMPPDTVAAVIERIGRLWRVDPGVEITLEANPSSVEAGNFAALRSAGVNRLSLGIQALREEPLRFLGRAHDLKEGLAAIDTARRHFERYSFDLIYARPDQTLDDWRRELDEAIALAGDHLSLYQLTIERGTRFWTDHAKGKFAVPDEDHAAALYEVTQARLEAAGLPAYEISNHARPGGESRHNLVYWRYQDYVGVGPGAHGRFMRDGVKIGTRRASGPEAWLEQVEASGHGTAEREAIDAETMQREALMMGLRLKEGVDLAALAARGIAIDLDRRKLAPLVENRLLETDDGRLVATNAGRQVLNTLLLKLLD
ncbi:MAG: radical SAM family heme chaperone HemW [Reyranellaceae bacterium]